MTQEREESAYAKNKRLAHERVKKQEARCQAREEEDIKHLARKLGVFHQGLQEYGISSDAVIAPLLQMYASMVLELEERFAQLRAQEGVS